MVTAYKWSLRKGGKKLRCPQCGKLRFVPFVLTADPTVKAGSEYGRCDREQSCGYFRYPGSEVKADTDREYTPEPPKEPMLFSPDLAEQDAVTTSNSLFHAYAAIIRPGRLRDTMTMYNCGTGGMGECIYYQYDGEHVRTAKAILYGADGHRIKREDGGLPVFWLHKSPQYADYVKGHQLKQCFFGQHLLEQYPTHEVWVVESEKTAVLMAATDQRTDRVWIACGGSQMLKGAIDFECLRGRNVVLVPDDGQYWNWKRTADANGWRCYDITSAMEARNLPEGSDIWDIEEYDLKNNKL